tara:strand:- start:8 stop:361 length:354 start_codon:yes stop_codon:yes gene_type:complete
MKELSKPTKEKIKPILSIKQMITDKEIVQLRSLNINYVKSIHYIDDLLLRAENALIKEQASLGDELDSPKATNIEKTYKQIKHIKVTIDLLEAENIRLNNDIDFFIKKFNFHNLTVK